MGDGESVGTYLFKLEFNWLWEHLGDSVSNFLSYLESFILALTLHQEKHTEIIIQTNINLSQLHK